jgi:zinc-ribbon domain
VSAPAASCPSCGSALPERRRFCPECGARLEESSETAVTAAVDPVTETVPLPQAALRPRSLGLTAPTLVFGLALAALAVGILLLVDEKWLAGALCGVAALLLFAGFALMGRPAQAAPEPEPEPEPPRRLGGVGERAASAVGSMASRSRVRRELIQRRYALVALGEERERRLRSLGEAVHEGDEPGAETLRRELSELERQIAETQAEMATLATATQVRLDQPDGPAEAPEVGESTSAEAEADGTDAAPVSTVEPEHAARKGTRKPRAKGASAEK